MSAPESSFVVFVFANQKLAKLRSGLPSLIRSGKYNAQIQRFLKVLICITVLKFIFTGFSVALNY